MSWFFHNVRQKTCLFWNTYCYILPISVILLFKFGIDQHHPPCQWPSWVFYHQHRGRIVLGILSPYLQLIWGTRLVPVQTPVVCHFSHLLSQTGNPWSWLSGICLISKILSNFLYFLLSKASDFAWQDLNIHLVIGFGKIKIEYICI